MLELITKQKGAAASCTWVFCAQIYACAGCRDLAASGPRCGACSMHAGLRSKTGAVDHRKAWCHSQRVPCFNTNIRGARESAELVSAATASGGSASGSSPGAKVFVLPLSSLTCLTRHRMNLARAFVSHSVTKALLSDRRLVWEQAKSTGC